MQFQSLMQTLSMLAQKMPHAAITNQAALKTRRILNIFIDAVANDLTELFGIGLGMYGPTALGEFQALSPEACHKNISHRYETYTKLDGLHLLGAEVRHLGTCYTEVWITSKDAKATIHGVEQNGSLVGKIVGLEKFDALPGMTIEAVFELDTGFEILRVVILAESMTNWQLQSGTAPPEKLPA